MLPREEQTSKGAAVGVTAATTKSHRGRGEVRRGARGRGGFVGGGGAKRGGDERERAVSNFFFFIFIPHFRDHTKEPHGPQLHMLCVFQLG